MVGGMLQVEHAAATYVVMLLMVVEYSTFGNKRKGSFLC